MKIKKLLVRPRIYRLDLKNFPIGTAAPGTDRDKLEKWGWVDVWELFECIAELPGAPELIKKDFAHPVEILHSFAALNDIHREKTPSVTFVNHFGTWLDSTLMPAPNEFGREFYVPAGWANNVIDLVELGVEKVWLELGHTSGWHRFASLNGMREPMVKASGGWRVRDEK